MFDNKYDLNDNVKKLKINMLPLSQGALGEKCWFLVDVKKIVKLQIPANAIQIRPVGWV